MTRCAARSACTRARAAWWTRPPGLLVDSMALVNAGLEVVAIERSPVVHALQQDAIVRAGGVPGLTLVQGDAIALLRELGRHARARPTPCWSTPCTTTTRATASPPKEMRALRLAVGADADGHGARRGGARLRARVRVVVKRGEHAPALRPLAELRAGGAVHALRRLPAGVVARRAVELGYAASGATRDRSYATP